MKVHLINMPFGYLRLPSIALTQLKSAVQHRFGEEVQVEIHYLNLDFGQWLGKEIYDFISESPAAMFCNIGEWLFRQAAFPESLDNEKDYMDHFRLLDGSTQNIPGAQAMRFFSTILLEKRKAIPSFLDQLIAQYDLSSCDLVGFTSMFAQNLPSFALARRLKQLHPDIITLMGGANCESPMGEAIVEIIPAIDYVFSGPALINFPLFIEKIRSGDTQGLHQIDGVWSKQNVLPERRSETLKTNGAELSLNESFELEYDDFVDLVEHRWKKLHITPVLLFETSRGCWWGTKAHCTFCGLNANSMAYRAMDPDKAITYLNAFFKKYGHRVKHYSSVDNIMPLEYLGAVFPYLRPPEDASLFYEVKADLSKTDLQILSSARVRTLQPGIESLNTATLKLMKKGETAVGNIALLKNAAALHMDIAWNLLIGLPGESALDYEVYQDDLSCFYHLQPPKSIYSVRFDRYSPYFNTPEQFGLHLIPADFYYFLYPERLYPFLPRIAYYFEDISPAPPYKSNVDKWRPMLQQKIDRWISRYEVQDDLARPELYLESNHNRIYDSRSGIVQRINVSDLDMKILRCLDQPAKLITLTQTFQEIGSDLLMERLEVLINKQLVYHEKHKKYLSLVHLGEDTASATFTTNNKIAQITA